MIINIKDYGAVSEGGLCTEKIQHAIDICDDGGCVVIPVGTYISGALFLKSNMTLLLEEGARLSGSDDTKDFPVMAYGFEGYEQLCYASLINTDSSSHKNICIIGEGVIDANGEKLFAKEIKENLGKRGRIVCIRNTENLCIKGVTFRQSPSWGLHLLYCNNIDIDGVSVHTKWDENGRRYDGIFNGDGIDVDSCTHVRIRNSFIASQDDSIAVKSGRDDIGRRVNKKSADIVIENCRFHGGFGVAIGSEMSGGVENVIVKDCSFKDTFSIASIKTPRGRGAYVRNIRYESCRLINSDRSISMSKWFRGVLNIDSFYGQEEFDADICEKIDEKTPKVENISFVSIDAESTEGYGLYVCGLPERHIKNIVLENVRVKGKYARFIKNAELTEIGTQIIGEKHEQ